jgi:hypothetical protein
MFAEKTHMGKILLTILFGFLLFQQAVSQLPASQKKDKLSISFNKNIELLGFAYFIAFEGTNSETKVLEIDGKEVLEKDWQNYGFHFYQRYKHLASSAKLKAVLEVTEHLWLSDVIPLLLQTDDFPNASLRPDIDEELYKSFSPKKNTEEARQQASIFLSACNDFYREVNFDHYLQNSVVYYKEAIMQINEHLPSTDFISVTEKFYRKSFDHYVLIPSLTIPKGMGFNSRDTNNVFNVFGAVDYQHFLNTEIIDMGFGDRDKLRELSVHEFGHSFVNPEVHKVPKEILQQSASLFEPLRTVMEEQGYNNWTTCLVEHFVRAGEVVIAEQMDIASSKRLRDEYINKRKFVYLPLITEELYVYKGDTNDNYLAMVNRVVQKLIRQIDNNKTTNEATYFTANPREAQFHTEDIKQFWELMDQYDSKPSGSILQSEYLEKGSIGLKGFVRNRIESGKNLSKVVRNEIEYYQYIRPFTLSIDDKREQFYQYFENLKQLYPAAIFPDVYFVIGANNTGGTIFDKGLIIGAEKFGKPNAIHKPSLDNENVHRVISHELIHFQQQYVRDNSLLAQTIKEGTADFLCELITGGYSSNKEMYAYGEAHKKELWQEFTSKMYQSDWNGWLYFQKDKSRPKDLGYWMGYKICKAYYENSIDKQKAIVEILTIKDFKAFLEKSGFNEK